MANFHPRIEEASERQLYDWVQNSTADLGSLASDELTRRQSKNLEDSNRRLQLVMLGLTAMTVVIAAWPALQFILNWANNFLNKINISLSLETINGLSAILSVIAGFATYYYTKKTISLSEKVILTDSLNITVIKKEKLE